MNAWDWKRRCARESWDGRAPRWLRPFSVAVPWLTAFLLFQMIWMMGGAVTSAEGALFALPETAANGVVSDVGESSLVALLQPTKQGTLVFFDDTRFVLDDDTQMERFSEQLAARVKTPDQKTLLALADIRVDWGDMNRFRSYALKGGVGQILFAEKKGRGVFE